MKRFGRQGRTALAGVDVDLKPGTLTAIVGGNGSGKSTLFRIIAGVSPPSGGSVVSRPRSASYVPECLEGHWPMTGSQYLVHMAAIRGLGGS